MSKYSAFFLGGLASLLVYWVLVLFLIKYQEIFVVAFFVVFAAFGLAFLSNRLRDEG